MLLSLSLSLDFIIISNLKKKKRKNSQPNYCIIEKVSKESKEGRHYEIFSRGQSISDGFCNTFRSQFVEGGAQMRNRAFRQNSVASIAERDKLAGREKSLIGPMAGSNIEFRWRGNERVGQSLFHLRSTVAT